MIPRDWYPENNERWYIRNLNIARSYLYETLFVYEYVKNDYKLVSDLQINNVYEAYKFSDYAVKRFIDENGKDCYAKYITSTCYGRFGYRLGEINL